MTDLRQRIKDYLRAYGFHEGSTWATWPELVNCIVKIIEEDRRDAGTDRTTTPGR